MQRLRDPRGADVRRGEERKLRCFVTNSAWLAAVFAVVMTVVVTAACRPVLRLMNTPAEIFDYAYVYIAIIFLGIPCTFLYNLLAAIIRSLGDSRTPVLFLALSSVLNIALDFLSILVLHMGVEGPALATVLSQGVSGGICLLYMRRKYPILHASREEWRPDGRSMRRLCFMGIPMGLQYSVTAIGSLVLQTAVNGMGAAVVAGVTAAQKINAFISCPVEALGQTMAPYAGQNMGAGRLDRIGKGLLQASLVGFAVSACCFLTAYLTGERLVLLFMDAKEAEIIDYAYRFLLCCTGAYCLLTLVNTVRFTIQGMGFSVFAILSGVMEMIARILAAVVIAGQIGFTGLCLAHPMAWLFADAFLIPAFFYCRKRIRKQAPVLR